MTREEYMAQSAGADPRAAHRTYYAQFVSARTITHVVQRVGPNVLRASTDEHFNDIPLRIWDVVARGLPIAAPFETFGDYATLGGLVCVAKEAARQWRERAGNDD